MDKRSSVPLSLRQDAEVLEPCFPERDGLLDARRAEVRAELDRLKTLDLGDLRIRYRQLTRKTAPDTVPKWLLLRLVAYRLQERAFGDLDATSRKALDGVARALAAADRARKHGTPRPVVPAVPGIPTRRFQPGTVLVREHGGALHSVTVMDDGFFWNGALYRSLSEVARAITGTVWNGHVFFGLKEKTRRRRGTPADEPDGLAQTSPAAPERRRQRSASPQSRRQAEGGSP